ncbi:MAG: flagellar hook-associated protein FlgL [Clostridium sp.]
MRITNNMMTNSFNRDMKRNLGHMQKLRDQLTSGKEIRKPSDNPFKAARSMQLHSDIQANTQYNTNITDTINHLETTDVALEQLTNVFQRVRELMVSSGNAAYGSDERNAINDEINEKVNEVSQILNTSFDGKYIFGGTKSGSKPVKSFEDPITGNNILAFAGKEGETLDRNSDDITVQNQIKMIGQDLEAEISQGVSVAYNVNAMDVLIFKNEDGNEVNVMDLISDITSNINSDNPNNNDKVTNENLGSMDQVIKNLLRVRSEVGAMQNRMESAEIQNEEENFNMKQILSKNEDIDLTEKTIEVSTAQTVYMASLQVSAKILQPTLMDYLR